MAKPTTRYDPPLVIELNTNTPKEAKHHVIRLVHQGDYVTACGLRIDTDEIDYWDSDTFGPEMSHNGVVVKSNLAVEDLEGKRVCQICSSIPWYQKRANDTPE